MQQEISHVFVSKYDDTLSFCMACFVHHASGSFPAVYCGRVINSRSSDDENDEENEACET